MPEKRSQRRGKLVLAAKLLIAGAILGWLGWQAQQNDKFHQLVTGQKHWGALLLAFAGACFTAVLSFLRWRLVARAAGVPLSVGEALRLGALGFTLNFVSPGSVGGDVFKAAVLARDRAGRRTAAVTTIVVDRGLALVSLLTFAAVGYLCVLATGVDLPVELRAAGWTAVTLAAALPIGLMLLLAPGVVTPTVVHRSASIPAVGGFVFQLLSAWVEYRSGVRWLLAALGMCFLGHLSLVTSFYLVAQGLPLESPGWLQHAFMTPFACLSGSIPLFPAGLGAVEGTLDYFYQWFGADRGSGAIVAFGYRLANVAVACILAPYYLTHQAIVRRALAEQQPEAA